VYLSLADCGLFDFKLLLQLLQREDFGLGEEANDDHEPEDHHNGKDDQGSERSSHGRIFRL
jgi:hypothetical protein